jgi:ATP-dependent Clp protease ATP-binding subunit ClpB
VDFKNAVVIMTSNLGSQFIAERARQEATELDEGTRRLVIDALRTHFPPEFLNRVDDVIVFHPLGRTHLRQIVDIQLKGLTRRLEDRKIRVELTDAARQRLVEEGYDPTYGARPLKRTIQRLLLDPLALRVLQGDFREGDTVTVDAVTGGLVFERSGTSVGDALG